MKLSPAEQEQLVALLTRLYMDLHALETEYGLLTGEGDFRPRIDYFHDAVRAFTSAEASAREPDGRLTVEWLAYDVGCLRYLQAMPLSPFTPQARNLSTGHAVVRLDQHVIASPKRPDRAVKERIAELYQHYGVIFAALFKPLADRDYLDRAGGLQHDRKDMTALAQALEGKADERLLAMLIEHIDDEALRRELMEWLRVKRSPRREDLQALGVRLKKELAVKDRQLSALDKAHGDYALAQLALYEISRDMVKKLAQGGMNLAGNFVEQAMREAQHERRR